MIKKAEAMELLDDYTKWLRSITKNVTTGCVNAYLEDKDKRQYKLEGESKYKGTCPSCSSIDIKVINSMDNLWKCNHCNRIFVD